MRAAALVRAVRWMAEYITEMNRTGPTDSKHSLDRCRVIDDSSVMLTQPYHLYIERTNAAKNMARYYALEISTTLFGDTCLTRRWGRIGFSGQTMAHHFEDERDAVRLFLALTRQKRSKGYRPCPLRGRALT
jgi:predicted DNA-binding WGR domain protein